MVLYRLANTLVVWSDFQTLVKPIVNKRQNLTHMHDYWSVYMQQLFSLGSDKNKGTAKQVKGVKPVS